MASSPFPKGGSAGPGNEEQRAEPEFLGPMGAHCGTYAITFSRELGGRQQGEARFKAVIARLYNLGQVLSPSQSLVSLSLK